MDRIKVAAELVGDVVSLLDVGCRDGRLRQFLPGQIEYKGCDLMPGKFVDYVGDITDMHFDRHFDCVVALDILEHVDELHRLFDKLLGLADRKIIVSLPNCYDLKSRYRFVTRGTLGGKYSFGVEPSVDRHRWIMSYREILEFLRFKARQHDLALRISDCAYGGGRTGVTSMLGVLSRIIGKSLTTETVVAVFERSTHKPSNSVESVQMEARV